MDNIAQINVKNVNAKKWELLTKRLPVSPSLIIRALISHALEMSDEEYRTMLVNQGAEELKEKG